MPGAGCPPPGEEKPASTVTGPLTWMQTDFTRAEFRVVHDHGNASL
jgi:hypothetical protein